MFDSNLGKVVTFLTESGEVEAKPPNAMEMRRSLYSSKLLGIMWFEDKLSPDLSIPFKYYMNPDWPNEPPPEGIEELMNLGDPALEYICQRLQRPSWMYKKKISAIFRFSEVEKDWERYRSPKV